ncbi:MAG: hypothetical protein NVS1B1_11050 [Candidatus Limnocylindrales bacterium]
MPGPTTSERASELLDAARETLRALGRTATTPLVAQIAADGVRRIEWSGSWLDEPYVPGAHGVPVQGDTRALGRRLHELADAFEELVEDFEGDDPVRNANGVQTGSLAFAVTGATAAWLRRLAALERSADSGPRRAAPPP